MLQIINDDGATGFGDSQGNSYRADERGVFSVPNEAAASILHNTRWHIYQGQNDGLDMTDAELVVSLREQLAKADAQLLDQAHTAYERVAALELENGLLKAQLQDHVCRRPVGRPRKDRGDAV